MRPLVLLILASAACAASPNSLGEQTGTSADAQNAQPAKHPLIGILGGGCTATVIHPHAVLTAALCYRAPGAEDNAFQGKSFALDTLTASELDHAIHPDFSERTLDDLLLSYGLADAP